MLEPLPYHWVWYSAFVSVVRIKFRAWRCFRHCFLMILTPTQLIFGGGGARVLHRRTVYAHYKSTHFISPHSYIKLFGPCWETPVPSERGTNIKNWTICWSFLYGMHLVAFVAKSNTCMGPLCAASTSCARRTTGSPPFGQSSPLRLVKGSGGVDLSSFFHDWA